MPSPEEVAAARAALDRSITPEERARRIQAAMDTTFNSAGQPVTPAFDVSDLDPNKGGGGWKLRSASGASVGNQPVSIPETTITAPPPGPPVSSPAGPATLAGPAGPAGALAAPGAAPGAPVQLPETTITPRAGGTPGAPGPGRPTAGPAPWLRNAVSPTGDLRAAPSEADQFQADFEKSLVDQGHGDLIEQGEPRTGEEIRSEAGNDPGLKPHTPGVPETADETAFLNENAEEQFRAGQDKLEAGEAATQQVLERHKQQLDQQEAIDAENAKRQAERSQSLERMETQYRELSDQMQNEPIDSQRLWNRKTTGEKVLGKLALFLGTVGFGVANAPNLVWQGMQADIDRDIDEQKANRAFQTSKLAAEGTLYGMARDRFKDEALTDASMREAAYGRMAKELENFEQTARTPERKAAIAELRAAAEEKYAAQQLIRRQRQDAYAIEQERLRRLASAGPDPLAKLKLEAKKAGLKKTIAEGGAAVAKADREIAGVPPPGETEPVPAWNAQVPKGSGKDAREFTAKMDRLRAAAADYRKLGVGSAGVDAAQSRMGRLLKEAGESSDTDLAERMKILPNPSNPNFQKRMDQFEKTLNDDENAFKKSLGVTPSFQPKTESK